MIDRVISLILIAVVAACPMMCRGGDCCSDHQPDDVEIIASHCCCCGELASCGEQPESEPPTDRRGQDPWSGDDDPCSGNSCCQCLCGGAVVAKVCHGDDGKTPCGFRSVMPDDAIAFSSLAPGRGVVADPCRCRSAKNLGRVIRTLHCSLLC